MKIETRAADRFEHSGRGGLLRQRLVQLVGFLVEVLLEARLGALACGTGLRDARSLAACGAAAPQTRRLTTGFAAPLHASRRPSGHEHPDVTTTGNGNCALDHTEIGRRYNKNRFAGG
ncbi:MAG: hypothetical protein WCA56_21090 [Xanthobacteraceae bacterium]